jgi:hypothetical protein
VQHICWSIGVIAAPLVAARVWNHHTRMDEAILILPIEGWSNERYFNTRYGVVSPI